MPEKGTIRRAQQKKREGKAATTQAGEFVAEEMRHAKQGKHTVKSRKQAVAIGLSKARRSGVKLGGPKRGGAKSSRSSGAKSSRSGAGRKASGRSASKRRSGGARRTGGARRSGGARSRSRSR